MGGKQLKNIIFGGIEREVSDEYFGGIDEFFGALASGGAESFVVDFYEGAGFGGAGTFLFGGYFHLNGGALFD